MHRPRLQREFDPNHSRMAMLHCIGERLLRDQVQMIAGDRAKRRTGAHPQVEHDFHTGGFLRPHRQVAQRTFETASRGTGRRHLLGQRPAILQRVVNQPGGVPQVFRQRGSQLVGSIRQGTQHERGARQLLTDPIVQGISQALALFLGGGQYRTLEQPAFGDVLERAIQTAGYAVVVVPVPAGANPAFLAGSIHHAQFQLVRSPRRQYAVECGANFLAAGMGVVIDRVLDGR